MKQWESDLHIRVAAAIKAARGKRSRSAQWLADRTAEIGYPITRAQIANYESGRKKSLDIADLLVLAAALNVSPTNLVFPGPYDEEVEFLPGLFERQIVAANWFSGIEPAESLVGLILPGERPPFHGDWSDWEDNTAFLQLSRALKDLEDMRNDFLSDHDRRQLGDDYIAKRLDSVEEQIRLLKRQISDRKHDA